MKSKKLLTISVLVLIVAIAYASSSIAFTNFKLSDSEYAYLGGLVWYKSIDKALTIAEQEDKPVMIYFWAIWCQFCEKFETETLPHPEVKKILTNDYVLVAIDLDEDRAIANKYGVSYPPYELFLDKKGNIIKRIPGFVEASSFLPAIIEIRDRVKGYK